MRFTSIVMAAVFGVASVSALAVPASADVEKRADAKVDYIYTQKKERADAKVDYIYTQKKERADAKPDYIYTQKKERADAKPDYIYTY